MRRRTSEQFSDYTMYAGDCIVWIGRFHTEGYGMCGQKLAHRVSYERTNGAIPSGMQIDHLCRNRACVNPCHLRIVTLVENAFAPGSMSLAHVNIQKTHCARGHEFSGYNLFVPPRGGRQCRACKSQNDKKLRDKRTALGLCQGCAAPSTNGIYCFDCAESRNAPRRMYG